MNKIYVIFFNLNEILNFFEKKNNYREIIIFRGQKVN